MNLQWRETVFAVSHYYLSVSISFFSGMFTALNNGIVSAFLAFSRSFVFMIICLLVLPFLFQDTGIWLATPLAELLAILLGLFVFVKYRNQYGL